MGVHHNRNPVDVPDVDRVHTLSEIGNEIGIDPIGPLRNSRSGSRIGTCRMPVNGDRTFVDILFQVEFVRIPHPLGSVPIIALRPTLHAAFRHFANPGAVGFGIIAAQSVERAGEINIQRTLVAVQTLDVHGEFRRPNIGRRDEIAVVIFVFVTRFAGIEKQVVHVARDIEPNRLADPVTVRLVQPDVVFRRHIVRILAGRGNERGQEGQRCNVFFHGLVHLLFTKEDAASDWDSRRSRSKARAARCAAPAR